MARVSPDQLRPLLDLALTEPMVKDAASELWNMVMADGEDVKIKPDPQTQKQVSRSWVYAAGCLASELLDVFERKSGGLAESLQAQAMRSLQWAAKLHLRWAGTGGASTASTGTRLAIPESTLPERRRSVYRRRLKRCTETAGSCSKAAADGTSNEEGSDAASDTASEGGSKSSDDHASDLEDFIDCSEESNSYGALWKCSGSTILLASGEISFWAVPFATLSNANLEKIKLFVVQ